MSWAIFEKALILPVKSLIGEITETRVFASAYFLSVIKGFEIKIEVRLLLVRDETVPSSACTPKFSNMSSATVLLECDSNSEVQPTSLTNSRRKSGSRTLAHRLRA